MKRISLITLLFCCALTAKAQVNLVLNGSFELNNPLIFIDTATGVVSGDSCYHDMITKIDYENVILYSYHFGNESTTLLVKDSCLVCFPSVYWGGGAQKGNYFLAMAGESFLFPWGDSLFRQGKISLALDVPLNEEKRYKLSFWIKDPPIYPNCKSETKNNYINVGISNYEDQLGRHLITSNYGDTIWQEYTYIFETQMAEEHITVTAEVDTNYYGVLIDHFVLTETEEPLTTGINELNGNNRKLLKIVDLLGKESKPKQKGLLFYIYSDGTVEKKIVIE
mgnify:CR=1 FL=1